jgi:hypothetical protein
VKLSRVTLSLCAVTRAEFRKFRTSEAGGWWTGDMSGAAWLIPSPLLIPLIALAHVL